MPDIVITEFMNEAAVETLRSEFSVHWDEELSEKRSELIGLIKDAKALIVRNKTQVDQKLLDAAQKLLVIGRLGVGLDNIDMTACAARGIEVCPATGANTASVAEYVIAAALILTRGAFMASHDLIAGHWTRQALAKGGEISGRKLGLIGFGIIGQAVADRATALGMRVLAYDSKLPEDHPAWKRAEQCSLEAILSNADIISLHVPLTEETRNVINSVALQKMKPGTILINTARGGIVDEAALVEALHRGHLGGAALDVYEDEPANPEKIRAFEGLSNLILTPHIAGLTLESSKRVSDLTAQNVLKVLRAKT